MNAFDAFVRGRNTLCDYVTLCNYTILRGKSDTIILIKLIRTVLESNQRSIIKNNENKS